MSEELSQRVLLLEQQLAALKTKLESERPQPPGKPRRLLKLLIEHWTPPSVLGGFLVLLYVKQWFGVDFFEAQRNTATTKALAAFHRGMGDRLLRMQDWEAAEQAYRTAVSINPHDIDAQYGVTKAQVFQPIPGFKYVSSEVVDLKLVQLATPFPEDPQVDFLRGIYHLELREDLAQARRSFEQAIEKGPDLAAGYLGLGLIQQRSGEVEAAISSYEAAVQRDGESVAANNNLGFLYLLTQQYPQALHHLARAYKQTPSLLTALNLSDTLRLSGGQDAVAHSFSAIALAALSEEDTESIEQQRYIGGTWTYNYPAVRPDDRETIKKVYLISGLHEKTALAKYSLAFNSALLGDFAAADKSFEEAQSYSHNEEFRGFIRNKVQAVLGLRKPEGEVRSWFEKHEGLLSQR